MKNNYRSRMKNLLIVGAFPLVMWLLMEVLCVMATGKHVFNSLLDIQNFVRNTGIATCTALALSFNLGNGRFDLSLGAQRMAAAIIGGNLAIRLGLGSAGVILFALAFGLLFGTITGLIFVIFRIPPMVLGIGMALIYECLAFITSNSQGLVLHGVAGVEGLSNMYLCTIVVLMATLIAIFINNYTTFGFHTRAISGSQKISHNSGINIFAHAVGCYAIAGGLVSFSGVFDAAFKGVLEAKTGMSSAGTVMSNCFPMFLGGYLSRWVSQPVGILIGAMTIRIFMTGLSVLKFSATAQNVFNLILFLLFLIFRANEDIFKEKRAKNERIGQANEKKKHLDMVS